MNKEYNDIILKLKYLILNLYTVGLTDGIETIKVDYLKDDFHLILDINCAMLYYEFLESHLSVCVSDLDDMLENFDLLDHIKLEVSIREGFSIELWKDLIENHNIGVQYLD